MASVGPNRVLDAAREIQEFCEARGWSFCFIGALAVQRWGEPRLTRDADLNVFTGIGDEGRYVEALLGHFTGALLVFKAFADRPRDWLDIEGVVARSGALVDWPAVEVQLQTLLDFKEDRSALERLRALRSRLQAG